MEKNRVKFFSLLMAVSLLAPVSLLAQNEKEEKDKENKENKEKKEVQQIIVTRKGDKADKVVIEVDGDKVTVNGKPLTEYKDKDGNVTVRVNKLRDAESFYSFKTPKGSVWSTDGNNNFNFNYLGEDENKAMLGVTTEKTEEGAEINDVTSGSAADKAGLKENDVITKIDGKKIEGPDDLSEVIKSHKPGDKVTVTYLRDKKEQKATAELTKWKGLTGLAMTPGKGLNFDNNMHLENVMPKIRTAPGVREPFGQYWSWTGNSPKLGLSVQDTDDGKGVKVVEVDEESNAAKAGVKKDDVITEVNGKAMNSTDDMVKMIRENKEKTSIMLKLQRNGKTENIEVKMPRKIKTADL